MRRIVSYLTAAAWLCMSAAAFPACAADSAAGMDVQQETPLMVIRFNAQHVPYAMPLYNTISRALQVKPNAVFDIVSVAPRARTADKQPYFNTLAAQDSHRVLNTLHEIGLPADRISLVDAIDDVSACEVRIFVHLRVAGG